MKTLKFISILIIVLFYSCGGNTPEDKLVKAAAKGNLEEVKKLLDEGVDINGTNTGMLASEETACMVSAKNGHFEVLKYLAEKGADIRKANSGGENSLTYAAKGNQPQIVLYLIDRGIDVNYQERNYGMTAFLHAASFGDVAQMKALIDKGADVKILDKNKSSALHIAAFNKKPDVVTFLIKQGLDPNAEGNYLWTPLIFAASTTEDMSYSVPDDVQKTISALIRGGADVNKKDGFGNQPIIHAAMDKSHALINFLVNTCGADPNAKNDNGSDYQDVLNTYNNNND